MRNVRKCFVPKCKNNADNAPNKLLIPLPTCYEQRKLWFKAVGREYSKTANFRCCEDHFNLEEDAENYFKYKCTGCRLILKSTVVPHKFMDKPSSDVDHTQVPKDTKRRIEEAESVYEREKKRQIDDFFKSMPGPSNNRSPSFPSSPMQLSSSPMQPFSSPKVSSLPSANLSSPSKNSKTTEEYAPSTSTESSEQSLEDGVKQLSRTRIELVIECASRFYLGLPKEVYFIVKTACLSGLRSIDVLVTLKKIRLNDPFFRLGVDFGYSTSYMCAIFNKSIKPLASLMQQLIIWPSRETNFKHLPIGFRRRYSKVESIIDCFEILIQKPSNPIHQSLTWSSYKNGNTIKFLISCSPNGLINFISEGFGGRTSDLVIVKESGYLKCLPNGAHVMADRGFKHLSALLQQKNSTLIRPPSVSEHDKMSKAQAHETKRIAALRIHVERVIGRIREFNLLGPYAHVDIHLLGCLNHAAIIACGVINLQPALINY